MPTPTTLFVSGLPTLAGSLRSAGYDIVDDTAGFEEAAVAARRLREEGRLGGLIVSDVRRPSIPSWLTRQTRLGMPIVLLTGVADTDGLDDPDVPQLELPATVAEILEALQITTVNGLDRLIVVANGGRDVNVIDRNNPTSTQSAAVPLPPTVDAAGEPAIGAVITMAGSPTPGHGLPAPAPGTALPPPPAVGALEPITPAASLSPELATGAGAARSTAPAAPVADLDQWLNQSPTEGRGAHEYRRTAGVILFVAAGKGGSGKSTVATNLAQYCAREGLSAVAIDMNRGQADMAGYLKVVGLPTIVDAAVVQPIRLDAALLTPDRINAARKVDHRVEFHAVLGPRGDANSDPTLVTDAAYRAVIREASQRFDLVVVDTQTIEARDTSALIDGVLAPMVIDRTAWVLGVMDSSSVSVSNLYRRFAALINKGATPDRLMVLFNRQGQPNETGFDLDRATDLFNGLATVIGSIPFGWGVGNAGNTGGFITDYPAAATVLRAVLSRATGLSVFNPIEDSTVGARRKFWQFWK